MSQPTALPDIAWSLLNSAAELYHDDPRALARLTDCRDRLGEPLRIAVAGAQGVGKSTLVNALAGERVAPIEVGEGSAATGVFAWYSDAATPNATVFPAVGRPSGVEVQRRDRRLHIDLRHWQPSQVDRVAVDWPSRGLRDITLIDTPQATSAAWLACRCDAVLYLDREPWEATASTLRAVQHAAGPLGSPAHTIMVLGRADEVGAGRIDALSSAKQVARRRRADPSARALCQDVVAVSGLLAEAGRTLGEDDLAAMRALATLPRAELDEFLLSVDRFVAGALPVQVEPSVRAGLLDRFGVFGIRLATTLVRRGAETHSALAGQLAQRSGLPELRESVGRYLTDREDVLRARSALLGLWQLLCGQPRPQGRALLAAMERALASDHQIIELRLLSGLAAGRPHLPDGLADRAERLLGGLGTGLPERLGADPAAGHRELAAAAYHALGTWQATAENAVLSAEQRAAARVVVRSCEGMLAGLGLTS